MGLYLSAVPMASCLSSTLTAAANHSVSLCGPDSQVAASNRLRWCTRTWCWWGLTIISSTHFRREAAVSQPVGHVGRVHCGACLRIFSGHRPGRGLYRLKSGLSAFDADGCGAKTCAPLWEAVDKNLFFYGSPAVANGLVYIPLESQVNVYSAAGCGTPVCSPQAILFGTGFQDAIESSPTVANGVVYAGRNSGELLAWRANCHGTCNEIWIGHTDDPILNSSPTVVNGKIDFGGSQHGFGGRLYVFGLP